ncbi:hypothetical protein N9H93_05635, partial [Rhizobiaceae bacterium]|nr:hypothetical protein [Rhizobiaceae bacterium]
MVLRKKSLIKRGAEALARTASGVADRFVHDEASDRALQARCIAVAGGLTGACLCAVPPTLVLADNPLPTAAALAAAGIVAGASAISISRSGRLAGVRHVSTIAVQGGITALAALSGGLASPLVALIPVLPFVSAMRLDRPLLRTALAASVAGLAWLALSPATQLVSQGTAAIGVGLAFASLALGVLSARGRKNEIQRNSERIEAVLQQRTGSHILSHAVGPQAL